jgi:NAD(P)H-dependent FMN reductase
MTHVVTVCGSLSSRSSNRAALDVVAAALGAAGATVDDFERLADIPAFDPDREEEPIEVLADWRRRLAAADAVVVAVPEYAGAVAGAIKNAFDWTVGGADVYRRPMAVISAGTSGGPHARQMMVQTLTWQGAHVVAELGIAAPRTKSDADGRFTDPPTIAALEELAATVLWAPSADDHTAAVAAVLTRFGIDPARIS